ncbi:MAG: 3-hydroxybutyryl-CoA dehydrogenase [Flavobacteriales bacterium]|jgi:3-hydroxybutyryl-CoA dehydrogenase|nr:3-hydroxybutyryl-CoA dehydrogenase [Flavobacteriales bacterium]|tara:strand:- start:4439 stop:5326 length:888 start_codon:yes stop_codon:yes gene_type:complete
MKKISVIGAGTMGNGIAHCFAQKEFEVALVDLSIENLNNAKTTISKNLDRMIKKEIINLQQKELIISRISFQTELNDFVKNSDLIIEAVTESKNVKIQIFKELDHLCKPETILASNTSSISINDIAKATNRQNNVIGMHFMNPVPIMKLIEVIKTNQTSENTINKIMQLSTFLEKKPVLVNDFPGFVANRILLPMINEAIQTLEDQVSGVSEIDTVMMLGMSHPMGPLQLADFIGLDVCLSILEVLHDGLKHDKYKPNRLLIEMVEDGELGVKSKQGFYNYENGIKNKIVNKRFT